MLSGTWKSKSSLIWSIFSSLISVALCPVYIPLSAASNEPLPKLYAVSMMWTLNARVELRSLPWGNRSTLSYITSRNKSSLATKGPIRARPVSLFFFGEGNWSQGSSWRVWTSSAQPNSAGSPCNVCPSFRYVLYWFISVSGSWTRSRSIDNLEAITVHTAIL